MGEDDSRRCSMKIFQVFEKRNSLRVCLICAFVALEMSSSANARRGGVETKPEEEAVYLTRPRTQQEGDGGIFKLNDLETGEVSAIVTGLSVPDAVVCGPDGRLYFIEVSSDGGTAHK